MLQLLHRHSKGELRPSVPTIYSALPHTSAVVCELDKKIARCKLGIQKRLDNMAALENRIIYHAQHLRDGVNAEVTRTEQFAIVTVKVKRQVLGSDTGPLSIFAISTDCMYQQVQLKTQLYQSPILRAKSHEKWPS